jgi:iron complex transport system substrate-binding protein
MSTGLVLAFALASPLQVVDDQGTTVRFAAPPARIVTLAPHLSELVHAAGAGLALVGRDSWSDHPAVVRRAADVGDAFRVDLERLAALRPDLVLAWGGGTPEATVARIRALGIAVAVLEPKSLEDPARHLELLGRLTGHAREAREAADRYRAALAALRERYGAARKVRVFYQVNERPLYTVNGTAPLGQMLALCGGENPFAELPVLAPVVSAEAVVAADPEVVISAEGEGGSVAALRRNWSRWPQLAAARRDAFVALDAALVTRPGPRLVEGAALVCAALDSVR